jgi:AraC-like DNA-binding protein
MADGCTIFQWRAEGIDFRRVEVTPGAELAFSKVFYDEAVLLAFTDATWYSELKGTHYVETPDCVVLRDAGQVFSSRLGAHGASTCRELYFPAETLRVLGAPRLDFHKPVLRDLALAQELLRVHALFEQLSCPLEASVSLAQLLGRIAGPGEGSVVRPCSKRSRRIIEYLRANYAQKVTLTELSQLTDTNPYVLLRQFRKETGATPHDYLSAYRVYRAQALMREGVKLSEVATRCGFADQSHFNRQFKRSMSISPKTIRSTLSNTRARARAIAG